MLPLAAAAERVKRLRIADFALQIAYGLPISEWRMVDRGSRLAP
jgi:hypothetical protein